MDKIDWKAIEANEKIMDQELVGLAKDQSEGGLALYQAARLQRGILRHWFVWLHENRTSPERLVNAACEVFGCLIAELIHNMADEGQKGEALADILSRILAVTLRTVSDYKSHAGEYVHFEGTKSKLDA